MMHLPKERFPAGVYHKLQDKKLGPLRIGQKISANAYILDLRPDMHISPTFNVAEYHPPDDTSVLTDNSESISFMS